VRRSAWQTAPPGRSDRSRQDALEDRAGLGSVRYDSTKPSSPRACSTESSRRSGCTSPGTRRSTGGCRIATRQRSLSDAEPDSRGKTLEARNDRLGPGRLACMTMSTDRPRGGPAKDRETSGDEGVPRDGIVCSLAHFSVFSQAGSLACIEFLNRVRRFDSSRGHHLKPHVNGPSLCSRLQARAEWPRIGPAADTSSSQGGHSHASTRAHS
jgi:hypothetical protein